MDRGGKAVGMLVFLIGVAILLFVFLIAYRMFSSPASVFLATSGAAATKLNASSLVTTIVLIFVKIALLFVMTLAASSVASRGIQIYHGGQRDGSKRE